MNSVTTGIPSEVSSSSLLNMILIVPGMDPTRLQVPSGCTAGQLLSHRGVNTENQVLKVGANSVENDYILQDQDVMFLIPQPKNG